MWVRIDIYSSAHYGHGGTFPAGTVPGWEYG